MAPRLWLAAFLTLSAYAAELPIPALLVLNKEESTLAILDPENGKISTRISTGEGPHEIDVSADGRLAFVTNYGSGKTPGSSLSVIDLATAKEIHRVDLKPMHRPHGIFAADGKVWFTAEGSKLVGRYDPATNKVDYLMGTGQDSTHMVMLSKDSKYLFTANIASDTISIFALAPDNANWNQTVVPVGKGPEGMDLTPDGRHVWTAHSRDGGVSIIDISARKVVGTMDLGTKRSNRLKLTLDGKLALVSDMTSGDLVIVDVPTRKLVKKVQIGKAPEGILMDPAGGRAFIALAGDNQIAVFDLKKLTVERKLQAGKGPDGLAWVTRVK